MTRLFLSKIIMKFCILSVIGYAFNPPEIKIIRRSLTKITHNDAGISRSAK